MKLIALTLITAISLNAAVTTKKIDCDSGLKGFTVEVSKEGNDKMVSYNSCIDNKINVYKTNISTPHIDIQESISINGKDYFFSTGYTEPDAEATSTCSGGYPTVTGHVVCDNDSLGTELQDGWLNLVEVNGWMAIRNNPHITNVDNLSNITKVVSSFDLNGCNNLENVDGLRNLTEVRSIYLNDNPKLSNLNGLRSLKRINVTYTDFTNNPSLTDISGLSNLEYVAHTINLDNKEFEGKLKADSYLCQNFATKVTGPSNKSYVCEEN